MKRLCVLLGLFVALFVCGEAHASGRGVFFRQRAVVVRPAFRAVAFRAPFVSHVGFRSFRVAPVVAFRSAYVAPVVGAYHAPALGLGYGYGGFQGFSAGCGYGGGGVSPAAQLQIEQLRLEVERLRLRERP